MTDYIYFFQIIGIMIVIIICCYLVLRYGLRAIYPGMNKGYLKVVEKVPLDHKGGSALVLARLGNAVLLIGVAQGRVSLLKEIPADSLPPEVTGGKESASAAPLGFARILQGLKRGAAPDPEDRGGVD